MECPICYNSNNVVKDSRTSDNNKVIRRRRYCMNCGGKFTTFERIEETKLIVIKRNGYQRLFDRDKVFNSVTMALRKRNLKKDVATIITNNICKEVESISSREVTSDKIGRMIMDELLSYDPVAYVRFASVYRDFTTISDFVNLVDNIKKNQVSIRIRGRKT
ncbi:MAG TPA: transcriptional regulator NrdR [Candidatus Megaira endosymbiont of Hartmannula sinica]|nr:transcriptional regulator NrdR [Candidatus Megaera endosymbiont of Hartmannula sinica]